MRRTACVCSVVLLGALGHAAQPQAVDPAHAQQADSTRFRAVTLPSGKVLRYLLLMPPALEAGRTAPVVLLLPPGDQGEAMVEEGARRYVESAAAQAGWVVLSPAAPAGRTFVDDPTPLVELLGVLPTIVKAEAGIHVAGVSNGGIAALRLARLSPSRVASVVVLPGFMPDLVPKQADDLAVLRGMPISIFVGADDREVWRDNARQTAEALGMAGAECVFEVVAGQGHVLDLGPRRVIETLEAHRRTTGIKAAIGRVLDDFHDAAAKADEARYFGHFAPGAVFLGTDATERWTLEAFRAWVRNGSYFAPGRGWTYQPKRRTVTVGADGRTAWFDETLENAKLGACRGTGVLLLTEAKGSDAVERWKVAQYNLTVPVPNDLMSEVVRMIREGGRTPAPPTVVPGKAPGDR